MREVVEELPPLDQLLFRHPEHALDVEGVADAYLDMGLRAETGSCICGIAFHEDPAHGVDGGFIIICSDFMKMRKYCTIQRAS